MEYKIEKPIGQIVTAIIDYIDPDLNINIFYASGPCGTNKKTRASHDEPSTLEFNSYVIVHYHISGRHAGNNSREPTNDLLVEIAKDPANPDATIVRTIDGWIEQSAVAQAYVKLEELLRK